MPDPNAIAAKAVASVMGDPTGGGKQPVIKQLGDGNWYMLDPQAGWVLIPGGPGITAPSKAGGMSPVYDPRTAQDPYMTPWGEPVGGSRGDVIALQNKATGSTYTLPRQESPEDIALTREAAQADIDYRRRLTANVGALPQVSAAEWARIDLERQRADLARQQANQPNMSSQGRYVLKTDPWTGETTVAYEMPQEQVTPYQQATLDQSRTMADADREAAMARQKLSTTASLENSISGATQAARMWAMNSAWGGVPPGYEADGAYGRLLQMAGAQPRGVPLPQVNFDPTEAWRLAQGAVGVR